MCHQYSPVCSGILCKNIRMLKNMTPLKHKVHGMHVRGEGGGGDRLLYISWLATNEMKLYPMLSISGIHQI